MQNSPIEDQGQRRNTSMEDSTAMTIEFLRARLLTERSVSRTARQRADELAKRVAELEEQLKIVSLQRKKAEKAMADVLAILENNGMSDVSEAFDSSSDQEANLCESNSGNHKVKEESPASVNRRRNDMEAFPGSEIESSPFTGRSLSWKSGRDSSHSIEKKNYMDPSRRRRGSFASTGSCSLKCVGRSCRQIRRRETSNGVATHSEGLPNCSDVGPETSREDSENHNEKDFLEGPASGVLENEKVVTNNHYMNGHVGDKDMERALEHQAQLIGRYEAEEKAQREWEEMYRENNSYAPDSCDPGNHTDVSEEREEIKAPAPQTGTISSQNQEASLEAVDACSSKECRTPNGFQPPLEQKCGSMIAHEPSASEFSFPMAKGNYEPRCSENHHDPPLHDSCDRLHSGNQSAQVSSSHAGNSLREEAALGSGNHSAQVSFSHAGSSLREEALGSGKELALMLQGTDKLGSVLDALQQAKSSLRQKMNRLPLVEGGGSVGKAIEPSAPAVGTRDRLEIPVGCAGLFRLPTDFQFETTKANFRHSASRLSSTTYSSETAGDKLYFSNPYMESRSSTSAGDRFLTLPSSSYIKSRSSASALDQFQTIPASAYMEPRLSASTGDRFPTIPSHSYTEIRPALPRPMPVFEGRPSFSGYPHLNRQLSIGPPSSSKYTYPTYPFYPDLVPQMPANEGLSRPLPGREIGIPPATDFSFYDDHSRPNMYR